MAASVCTACSSFGVKGSPQLMCLAPPPSRLSMWLAEEATALEARWRKWKPALHRSPEQAGN